MSDANLRAMEREAADSGVDLAILKKLDACKAEPTMAHGPAKVLWWFVKPMVVGLLWLVPLFLVTANVTTWIPDLPKEDAGWLLRTWTTAKQGLLLLATGAALLWIRQYWQRVKSWRSQREAMVEREKARKGEPPTLVQSAVHDMRTMASYISMLVDVPYVTFGHTHYADIYRLDEDDAPQDRSTESSEVAPDDARMEPIGVGATRRWYFNTGTWMAIFEPREQLYREARQLTFLQITRESDGSSSAGLNCWYPPQSAPRPVVVVDMEDLDNGVENGILMSMIRSVGGLGGGRR